MNQNKEYESIQSKTRWLVKKNLSGAFYSQVTNILKDLRLKTVCREAQCPNMGECFSEGTATFLILGDRCTRSCGYCAIANGHSEPPDPTEPSRIAEAVQRLGLNYVVITSVTRDDLPDGGASIFADTIRNIRLLKPHARIETLIPDFKGSADALNTILKASPDVINHNIETVQRLYSTVRPCADYWRSLELLKRVHKSNTGLPAKSGIMLGLGEKPEEILGVFNDLLNVNCKILTLGQYLQPTRNHLPVKRHIPPEEFDRWRTTALKMGFCGVASGLFVRSSFHADKLFMDVMA